MENSKQYRVLEIFFRGLRGESLSVQTLANEYGVSTKSITRSINDLKDFLADHRELVGNTELQYSHKEKCYHLYMDEFLSNKELFSMIEVMIGSRAFSKMELLLQRKPRARYRIDHISWWKQELPSDEEYAEARKNLDCCDWQVDYILTHCAPTDITIAESRHSEADRLTDFLQEVKENAQYHYWLFGHYHDNKIIDDRYVLLWEQIIQII